MHTSNTEQDSKDNSMEWLDEIVPCISCGVNADPADGFGNCTCGNEKLRESIDQYTQSKLKAFAGEVELALAKTYKYNPLDNRWYAEAKVELGKSSVKALKAIKGKAGIE